jgi:hypothetical protein
MLDKTTVDIPSLLTKERLVAWLETMPPEGTYKYDLPWNCVLAKYFRDHTLDIVSVGSRDFHAGPYLERYDLPAGWNAASKGYADGPGPRPDGFDQKTAWTFGAALERARKLPD